MQGFTCAIILSCTAAGSFAQLENAQFYIHTSISELYTGSFRDGESRLVGTTGLGVSSGEIEFDTNGDLYALGLAPSNDLALNRLNLTDASVESSFNLVGPLAGFGLAFDTDGTALVHERPAGGPSFFRRYDVTTGQLLSSVTQGNTLVGRFGWELRSDGLMIQADNNAGVFEVVDPETGDVTSLGVATPGRVVGWSRFQDRTYFGVRVSRFYNVYEIDPFTGAFSLQATLGGDALDGSVVQGFAIIPTPNVAVTLGIAGVLTASRRRGTRGPTA